MWWSYERWKDIFSKRRGAWACLSLTTPRPKRCPPKDPAPTPSLSDFIFQTSISKLPLTLYINDGFESNQTLTSRNIFLKKKLKEANFKISILCLARLLQPCNLHRTYYCPHVCLGGPPSNNAKEGVSEEQHCRGSSPGCPAPSAHPDRIKCQKK